MKNKQSDQEDKPFYYVNPKCPADPVAKVFCSNSECVNFIPVHQTCNLKSILISEKGVCEFSVPKKITKLKSHAKPKKRH
jgi:hypothetical protein